MQVQNVQNNINFSSTYRIPLVELNVSSAKRDGLKKMVSGYQNFLYPKGNQGSVRLSIRKRLDDDFEQKLRQLGFKVYQKFEKHNIPKTGNRLDNYIKSELSIGNYKQFGKQKKR